AAVVNRAANHAVNTRRQRSTYWRGAFDRHVRVAIVDRDQPVIGDPDVGTRPDGHHIRRAIDYYRPHIVADVPDRELAGIALAAIIGRSAKHIVYSGRADEGAGWRCA